MRKDSEKKEGAGTEAAQTGESNSLDVEKSGLKKDSEKKEGAGTEAAQTGESNTIELEKSGLSQDTERKRVQGLRWPRHVKVMAWMWRKVVQGR